MIDSHVHIWELGRGGYNWITPATGILHQDYTIKQYEEAMQRMKVKGIVLVEAGGQNDENEYLLEQASLHKLVYGVVGSLDVERDDALEQHLRLSESPYWSGIRVSGRTIHRLAESVSEASDRLFRRLEAEAFPVDLLVVPGDLKAAAKWLEHYPRLRVIINHAGVPGHKGQNEAETLAVWREGMTLLSALPNVLVKISGLATQRWSHELEGWLPIMRELADRFGADRLLSGSDWPVCLNAHAGADVVTFQRQLLSTVFTEQDIKKITETNAVYRYGLLDY